MSKYSGGADDALGTILATIYVLPFAGESGRILNLTMLAASSLLINIRDGGVALRESEPDAASHTRAACFDHGRLVCETLTPLIVGGNFVGGAFRIPLGISDSSLSCWRQKTIFL